MEYVNKTPLMDEVLDAVVVKYALKSRSEAYPFVIGMATECLTVENFENMLKALA